MKKFSIVLAVIVGSLIILYQIASYFIFDWQREECVKDLSNDKAVSMMVKDVNAVCDCTTALHKQYGLMKTFLEDEQSESRQALYKEAQEKCLKPHMDDMNNIFKKALEEVIQENK